MSDFETFDKHVSYMGIFITTIFIIVMLSIVGSLAIAVFTAKEVNKTGLKGVCERIWMGEKK